MITANTPESGNTYWQCDIASPRGIVRCVVYLFVGAMETELATPRIDFIKHQTLCGTWPEDKKEELLAALCARFAVERFMELHFPETPWLSVTLPQMIPVINPPPGKDALEPFAECCQAWAWILPG